MPIDDLVYLIAGPILAGLLVTSFVIIVRSENPWLLLWLCWWIGRGHR